MAVKKKIAAMSITELENKFGVKAQKGTISNASGKYYLTVEGTKREIDPKIIVSRPSIVKTIAKDTDVHVIFSLRHHEPVVIIFNKPPWDVVMCYLVGEPISLKIPPTTQTHLIETLVKEGRLPEALGKQLKKDISAEEEK